MSGCSRRRSFALLLTLIAWGCAPHRGHEAGFWFDEPAIHAILPSVPVPGGGMTADELIVVHQAARAELESAFEGIPITISDRRDAFWRVVVEPAQPARRNARLPAAGETWAMGRFGAYSHVDFDVLAHAAVTYAPEGASRATVLAGLARGIGRTAAHELAHAALGPSPVMDLTDDEWSYEFHSHARAAHYYGALHWAMARPALLSRLGS